jgi:hypothetical protein
MESTHPSLIYKGQIALQSALWCTGLFSGHSPTSLKKKGANITNCDGEGMTPLHLAYQSDVTQMVDGLLEKVPNGGQDQTWHHPRDDSSFGRILAIIDISVEMIIYAHLLILLYSPEVHRRVRIVGLQLEIKY